MDRLEKKYSKVYFLHVNVDDDPELAQSFGVESIPCTVVVVNGRVAKKWVGVQSYNKMSAELEKHLVNNSY